MLPSSCMPFHSNDNVNATHFKQQVKLHVYCMYCVAQFFVLPR